MYHKKAYAVYLHYRIRGSATAGSSFSVPHVPRKIFRKIKGLEMPALVRNGLGAYHSLAPET